MRDSTALWGAYSGASLNAIAPITRFPAAMHHRDDQNVVRFDGIQHGIREDVSKTSPHVLFKWTPTSGFVGNLAERRLDTGDESKL